MTLLSRHIHARIALGRMPSGVRVWNSAGTGIDAPSPPLSSDVGTALPAGLALSPSCTCVDSFTQMAAAARPPCAPSVHAELRALGGTSCVWVGWDLADDGGAFVEAYQVMQRACAAEGAAAEWTRARLVDQRGSWPGADVGEAPGSSSGALVRIGANIPYAAQPITAACLYVRVPYAILCSFRCRLAGWLHAMQCRVS